MTSRGSLTFRQVDPAALDDDPFWATVRREHPDLELILLPPDTDPPDTEDAAPEDSADLIRAAVSEVAQAWSLLRPLVAAADPAEPERPPSVRWSADRLLVQRALVGIGLYAGTEVLRQAAAALGDQGWLLRPSSRGDHPFLEARNGDARRGEVELEGEAGPGATVLTLRSARLAVHADHRAETRALLADAVRS